MNIGLACGHSSKGHYCRVDQWKYSTICKGRSSC